MATAAVATAKDAGLKDAAPAAEFVGSEVGNAVAVRGTTAAKTTRAITRALKRTDGRGRGSVLRRIGWLLLGGRALLPADSDGRGCQALVRMRLSEQTGLRFLVSLIRTCVSCTSLSGCANMVLTVAIGAVRHGDNAAQYASKRRRLQSPVATGTV